MKMSARWMREHRRYTPITIGRQWWAWLHAVRAAWL